jgi:hypothetical protein
MRNATALISKRLQGIEEREHQIPLLVRQRVVTIAHAGGLVAVALDRFLLRDQQSARSSAVEPILSNSSGDAVAAITACNGSQRHNLATIEIADPKKTK